MVRRMVRAFRDLDAHVIFTAHEQEVGPDDKSKIVLPSLPGKLAKEIPGFIDEVVYIYARPTGKKDADGNMLIERRILAQPTPRYVVKSRGGLPVSLRDPSIKAITDIVLKG